jgi:long-chain acyl-CoA synthetase
MEKIRPKSYAPDLPEQASLADFFEDIARRYGDRPALANLGKVLTYAQLEQASRHFAAYLTGALRLEPGERIAVMLPNLLQQPIAVWGALRAGLIVVNTNPLYTARELEHQLVDSGASVLVVLENATHVLSEILPRIRLKAIIVARLGELLRFPHSRLVDWYMRLTTRGVPPYRIPEAIAFKRALEEGAHLSLGKNRSRPEDTAFLQYTGGTTGIAKGVMLSHRNLLANVDQCMAWMLAGKPLAAGREIVLTALPLYHVFALTVNLLCFTRLGSLNYLVTNPRDMPGLVKALGRSGCTAMTGVNTLFKRLLDAPKFDQLDFSRLKLVISGGMATEQAVAERWRALTGRPLTEGYGLSETSPVVAINPPGAETFKGSVGRPLSATECSIRDEKGRRLPPGRPGELWVRGPQVMKGYWNRPEETRQALTPDGWLRTGDIARMDGEGYLYIVDRKKDLILVSGFNVYAGEIEAVLNTHPAIRECGAVGVPDPGTGEAVKAFVVRRDESLDAETVLRHCRMNLAAYKVPKYIEFRDELPKNPMGKILRRILREAATER